MDSGLANTQTSQSQITPVASGRFEIQASTSDSLQRTARGPTCFARGNLPVSYAEGGTGRVSTYTASDPGGGTISWSLPNTTFETDLSDFSINRDGEFRFSRSPNHESPHDSNGDNVYKVTVRARDASGGTADKDVTITVTAADRSVGHAYRLSFAEDFTVTVELPSPDKVAGLTAMPGSVRGEIVLDWDPADGADSYEVAELRRRLPLIPILDQWVVLRSA